jgi:hypothetical protein
VQAAEGAFGRVSIAKGGLGSLGRARCREGILSEPRSVYSQAWMKSLDDRRENAKCTAREGGERSEVAKRRRKEREGRLGGVADEVSRLGIGVRGHLYREPPTRTGQLSTTWTGLGHDVRWATDTTAAATVG